MINIELEEIENIQREVDNGVISIDDIENRWVLVIIMQNAVFSILEKLSMSRLDIFSFQFKLQLGWRKKVLS